ncbi:MAG: RagB/SusD family nutrient uptake outer membrane protein [Chitinophagaceae bacterium]|nr:RagB/SusD family nutrient uptake outer membrane protein [Chitinophagaceae bacterium]
MIFSSLIKLTVLGVLLLIVSCTKLDENKLLYDQVTTENFYKTDAELASAVGGAYAPIYSYSNFYFILSETTSDEMVVPQRGSGWYDNGKWVRFSDHTYTRLSNNTDGEINDAWTWAFGGVAGCNKTLLALSKSSSPVALTYVSELKALRAIYYYWLLDLYGNVPIVTDFANTQPPSTKTRKEVYEFVEKELLDNINKLPKTGPADGPNYGRVNYYTAMAALAKLYLNAGVFTGTAQWQKAIDACNIIINSGLYSLAPTYLDNFKRNNTGSPEFIWAIPYDGAKAGGFSLHANTLHGLSAQTYSLVGGAWNGFSAVQEFYQSYIDPAQNPGAQGTVIGLDPKGTPTQGTIDNRLTNFLVGPQYAADGITRLVDGAAEASDPDGQPLTFTPYINMIEPNCWAQAGARISKWQFYPGMNYNLDNDMAIFRFADILLMKAECTARLTGNWNEGTVLATVNNIRAKHGGSGLLPLTALTAASFLMERSREMAFESVKRQDMIRFGYFNASRRFNNADPSNHVNIFPIPEVQLNANPNLVQNPGY